METQAQMENPARPAAAADQDDRIWAALAHGSALLVFFGPIVPVIMWFTQRKRSSYVALQSLQAMTYQSLFFWTWVLLIPLVTIVLVVVFVFAAVTLGLDENNAFLMGVLPQLLIWGTMLGTFILYAGIGLWGAIASLMGRDFRYPFFGDRMARSLEYSHEAGTLSEEKADHIVAAVCHSTAALLLWGLITPIVVWITQGERSRFLGFQSLQAAIYQGLGTLAYFAFMVLYFVSFFGFMGATLYMTSAPSSGASPAWMGAAFLPFLAILCIFALGMPVYQILAFVAAVRVLNGHDFQYPILGGILARRMKPTEAK